MRYEALIRRTFDVQQVSGEEFVCTCPWHADGGKPNLYVNGVKGVYLCMSCGAKGHMKSVGKVPPADREDLLRQLQARQEPKRDVVRYDDSMLDRYRFPHPYWTEERGLSQAIVDKFDLGYDPLKDVVTIPLRDHLGKLLGVIERRLDDQRPKYKYPAHFPMGRFLFGAWCIRQRHRRVAIVEGSVDAIACWDARVPAVALLGSRLTDDQTRVLKRLGVHTVVLMLDNDGPGEQGTAQVREALQGTGIVPLRTWYRPYWLDKDPASLKPDRRRKMFHSAKPWYPG